MNIRLVITGRGYHLADQLPDRITLDDGATVRDALAVVNQMLGERGELPPSCLVSVAGDHAGTLARHDNRPLTDGDELMLIAPVAGG